MTQNELNKILKEHNLWLYSKGKEGKRANLKEAFLYKANLYKANLERKLIYMELIYTIPQ